MISSFSQRSLSTYNLIYSTGFCNNNGYDCYWNASEIKSNIVISNKNAFINYLPSNQQWYNNSPASSWIQPTSSILFNSGSYSNQTVFDMPGYKSGDKAYINIKTSADDNFYGYYLNSKTLTSTSKYGIDYESSTSVQVSGKFYEFNNLLSIMVINDDDNTTTGLNIQILCAQYNSTISPNVFCLTPTSSPTIAPRNYPTSSPTFNPTDNPMDNPTFKQTASPTSSPTLIQRIIQL